MRLVRLFAPALLVALCPKPALAVASAELYNTQAYVYGRFEARIRYAPGDGVISSFFLWKEGSEKDGAYWNELDFEKLNSNCRMQTNAIFGNPESGHEQSHTDLGEICAGYHDYAFEWTPSYISWVVDGREIRREAGSIATAFSQNATAGMTFHFNVWPGNANFGGNFDPAILPTRQYISWVRYSSFKNGSFQKEWQEDFQGTGVPSGWAVGSWASPLNLSTHNASNVTFASGIAVLSLTSDNGTGFSGDPPKDMGGAGGMTNGSGGTTAASSGGAAGAGRGGQSAAGGNGNGSGGDRTSGGANSGGSQGLGGIASASGGTSQSSGGASSSGGAVNSGGSTSASGGSSSGGASSGGSQASGGSAVAGGASNSGGALNAAGGSGAASGAPSNKDAGCSCSVAPRDLDAAPFAAVAVAVASACVRRRRRPAR
ncbi:MAG TPA: family 16 glycosylhydrolase [Polyangiaceae bacterium]|nr:family 16 glycosylhydrolase [Polyangiaceae bacterium]